MRKRRLAFLWHIVESEQGGQTRAAYGKRLLPLLAEQLSREFGKGFDERNLRHMRAFFQRFPIWNAVRSELSWTYYRLLSRVERQAARQWYMNEAAAQNWSSRALERQIGTLYSERLLLSQDKTAVADEAQANLARLEKTLRAFVRDPVMLKFLGLRQPHGRHPAVRRQRPVLGALLHAARKPAAFCEPLQADIAQRRRTAPGTGA